MTTTKQTLCILLERQLESYLNQCVAHDHIVDPDGPQRLVTDEQLELLDGMLKDTADIIVETAKATGLWAEDELDEMRKCRGGNLNTYMQTRLRRALSKPL